jgi:hypothetical protein
LFIEIVIVTEHHLALGGDSTTLFGGGTILGDGITRIGHGQIHIGVGTIGIGELLRLLDRIILQDMREDKL